MSRITTQTALAHAFSIRRKVFIEEQHVPAEIEFDQYDRLDANCLHVLVYHEGIPAATGRVRVFNQTAKLERICVLKDFRQYGLGRQVIHALERIAKEKHVDTLLLHAQTQATKFYERLGYQIESDSFIEDGILHVKMTKENN